MATRSCQVLEAHNRMISYLSNERRKSHYSLLVVFPISIVNNGLFIFNNKISSLHRLFFSCLIIYMTARAAAGEPLLD